MTERTLTQEELSQFTGTTGYWTHPLGSPPIRYTDGVKFLADRAGAYWLIDAIVSHQPELRWDVRLREFQLWELVVRSDRSATLTCRADSDQPPLVTQRIPWTDFPLDRIWLYVADGVILLPSEY